MSKVYVKDHDKLRQIGTFKEGIFYSERSSNKHFFVNENGWGIERKVIEGLLHKGLKFVVIKDTDDNTFYHCTGRRFNDYSREIHHPPHDIQLVLPIHLWESGNVYPEELLQPQG